jgi:hypothetical protein
MHALTLTLLLLAAVAGAPGGLAVSPPVVDLSAAHPFADVTVRNLGAGTREVCASVLAWSQEESGRVVLTGVVHAAVFPRRAILAPGEERRFRVSSADEPAALERAYRVALDVRDLGGGGAVTALVPAFFAPSRPTRAAAVRVACAPRHCRLVLENGGTVRLRPDHVAVAVVADGGATVERVLEGWWVLAGGSRVYEVPLEPGAPVSQVVAHVDLGGERVTAAAPVGP